MKTNLRCATALLAGSAGMLFSGCDTGVGDLTLLDSASTSTLALSTPPFLVQIRAIDPAKLILDVVVNGSAVNMQAHDDVWEGVINIPAGEVASIELVWSENIPGEAEPLQLAVYTDTIGPIVTAVSLPLTTGDYLSAGFDDDQDGIPNLEERREGTNARDASDPGPGSPANDADEFPIDVSIPSIASSDSPPVIDGIYDEVWDRSYFVDVEGDELSIDNLMLGEPVTRTDQNTEFQWTALHDDSYLYILVSGEFAVGATLFADSETAWKDDSVEIYIDGNNSKQSSYDQVDDYSFVIPHLKLVDPLESNNSFDADGRALQGYNSLPLPGDITFASCLCTSHNHLWEIRINLEQVGISIGQPFGIEVQLNDDRDGGERDVKWGWIHPSSTVEGAATDSTWMNPALMGTAILE